MASNDKRFLRKNETIIAIIVISRKSKNFQWPSVPSTALWKTVKQATPLALRTVLRNAFRQNFKDCRDLFCISNNCDNHHYHSSEILSDNREIAIIAIITLSKKLKSYFAKNWKRHFVSTLVHRVGVQRPFVGGVTVKGGTAYFWLPPCIFSIHCSCGTRKHLTLYL